MISLRVSLACTIGAVSAMGFYMWCELREHRKQVQDLMFKTLRAGKQVTELQNENWRLREQLDWLRRRKKAIQHQ